MKTLDLKKELPIWLIVLAPIAYMLINLNVIPDSIPTHWNVYGEIDGYGNPWLFPIFQIVMYVLLLVVPRFGKAAQNIEKFAKSYYVMRFIMHVFFSIIIAVILFAAMGHKVQIEKIIVPLILVVFMIIGNYMPTFRPNWFVGMRTPWTLLNDDVWKKTHMLSGRIWFWGSIIALPFVFYLEHMAMFIFFMLYIVVIISIPMIYSHRLFEKTKQV